MSTDFREKLYTIDTKGNRKWVYPTFLWGKFRKLRVVLIILLMALYLLLPWIKVGDEQAVFLDIFHRRFTFFGLTLWATDSYFLLLLLGSAAFSLFFFTSLLGRIWCGWACPETVFLEFLFRPIEQLIEGGPVERQRLDKAPWNFNKIFKKSLKFLIYAVISWILASTALAYFIGRERLISMMLQPPSANFGLFMTTLIWMGFLVFQFGWFREQFCTVLCPYARLQSVLLDQDSLVIGYDKTRGEPRGKKSDAKNGDCIDCGLCVRVCPTGIDIRNGLQLECIQCAGCIDACNSIMDKVNRPRGLIRYSTERGLIGGKFKIARPRVFVYAFILVIYAVLFTVLLSTRKLSEFQVIRATGDVPFTLSDGGLVVNHLHAHIANKSKLRDSYSFSVVENPNVSITVPLSPFPAEAESIIDVPLFFKVDKQNLVKGTLGVTVKVTSENGFEGTQKITLIGPG